MVEKKIELGEEKKEREKSRQEQIKERGKLKQDEEWKGSREIGKLRTKGGEREKQRNEEDEVEEKKKGEIGFLNLRLGHVKEKKREKKLNSSKTCPKSAWLKHPYVSHLQWVEEKKFKWTPARKIWDKPKKNYYFVANKGMGVLSNVSRTDLIKLSLFKRPPRAMPSWMKILVSFTSIYAKRD